MKKLFLAIIILMAIAFCAEGVLTIAANVRKAPSSGAEVVVDSITVDIIGDYSDYYLVKFISNTDHANDGIVYQIWTGAIDGNKIIGKGVILRDQDGKATGKTAKPGAEFEIIKKIIVWYQIELPDGTKGWVYKNSIRVIE